MVCFTTGEAPSRTTHSPLRQCSGLSLNETHQCLLSESEGYQVRSEYNHYILRNLLGSPSENLYTSVRKARMLWMEGFVVNYMCILKNAIIVRWGTGNTEPSPRIESCHQFCHLMNGNLNGSCVLWGTFNKNFITGD